MNLYRKLNEDIGKPDYHLEDFLDTEGTYIKRIFDYGVAPRLLSNLFNAINNLKGTIVLNIKMRPKRVEFNTIGYDDKKNLTEIVEKYLKHTTNYVEENDLFPETTQIRKKSKEIEGDEISLTENLIQMHEALYEDPIHELTFIVDKDYNITRYRSMAYIDSSKKKEVKVDDAIICNIIPITKF